MENESHWRRSNYVQLYISNTEELTPTSLQHQMNQLQFKPYILFEHKTFYAFLTLESEFEASRFLELFNLRMIDHRTIRVERVKGAANGGKGSRMAVVLQEERNQSMNLDKNGNDIGFRAWGSQPSTFVGSSSANVDLALDFQQFEPVSTSACGPRKDPIVRNAVAEALKRVRTGEGVYKIPVSKPETYHPPPPSSNSKDEPVVLFVGGLPDRVKLREAARIQQLTSIVEQLAENALCEPITFLDSKTTSNNVAYICVRNAEIAGKCIDLSDTVSIDGKFVYFKKARSLKVSTNSKQLGKSRYRSIVPTDSQTETHEPNSSKRVRRTSPSRSPGPSSHFRTSSSTYSPPYASTSSHPISFRPSSASRLDSSRREYHDEEDSKSYDQLTQPMFTPPEFNTRSRSFERVISHTVTFGYLTPSEAKLALEELEAGKLSSEILEMKDSYKMFLLSQLGSKDWKEQSNLKDDSAKELWFKALNRFDSISSRNKEFMQLGNSMGDQDESEMDPFEAVERSQNQEIVHVEKKRKIEW